MTALAWILAALPAALALYAYAAYPLGLRLLAALRRPEPPPRELEAWPRVSACLAAYNEERQLGAALDALLALDYPRGRLQVLVVSDASTDGTDELVRRYADRGVELLRLPVRGGKTAAENAAAPRLTGDVVLNTDASVRVHPGALKALVRRFADPRVGVASGRDVSVEAHAGCANAAEAGYVGWEMAVRALETRLGGIVGASGCLYAIRADLHRRPIPDHLSRDFAAALTACRHGYRAVSADDALCNVPRTPSLRREYRRKVRTINQGLETLLSRRELLNPLRHGGFAVKLWSHKLGRWAVPPASVPGVAGLALLAAAHTWAAAALVAAAAVVAVAAVGWFWPEDRRMPRLVALVAFPVAANVAVLHAIGRLLGPRDDHIWEPTRRTPAPTPPPAPAEVR
jgi:cellulose synthase/poly-beta-1,6-N-acetylglucosamine synthase-like glycosyltransferase